MTDSIIEDVQEDFFSRTADAILTKRKMPKRPPAPKLAGPRGPERYEIAEVDDTLAIAFAKGVEAGCDNMAQCCGCSGSGPIVNPYDGTPL